MTRQMVAVPMSASTEQGKSRVTVILATTLQMTGKRVQVMCLHAFSAQFLIHAFFTKRPDT